MRFVSAAVVLVVTLAGCGRLGFAPVGGGDDGRDDGGGDGDGGTGIDGATDRPNRVFVTGAMTNGGFGGLVQADAMCSAAAMTAALPGTFVAFLSTQTVLAYDRLAGSRGWVRTDDVPVADSVTGLQGGIMFNAIDRDEMGTKLTSPLFVWAGALGTFTEANCTSWTTTSGYGMHGMLGGAMPELVSPLSVYVNSCGSLFSIYCFEVGHDVPVQPAAAPNARIAFLATPSPHGGGVSALDSQCQAEASAASLSGTYLAAVASQGVSIASRFGPGMPWARPDGTLLSTTYSALFDGTDPLSFINQLADGTYVGTGGSVRTGGPAMQNGTSNTTCNSWTSTSNSVGQAGRKVARAAAMWDASGFACGGNAFTVCLQQ